MHVEMYSKGASLRREEYKNGLIKLIWVRLLEVSGLKYEFMQL